MKIRSSLFLRNVFGLFSILAIFGQCIAFAAKPVPELRLLGTYATGVYDDGAAEIVTHDPQTHRLFVVNGAESSVDVLDASDPSNPTWLFSIDVSPWGGQANSVDVHNGVVAAAVEADDPTYNGKVVFFDAAGNYLNDVPAGALPDMLTFTPNGNKVLVANEGEPSSYGQADSVDPLGSVTIVDLARGVANATALTVDFTSFNDADLDPRIRIYGPGASIAQDLEPEYITVDHNSKTAWITLQENNAIAVLDIRSATITDIFSLGFKDYSGGANKLDPSDRDGSTVRIANWPVFGMYQPDSIDSYKHGKHTYLVTANEGDARDYTGFAEEIRVGSVGYVLDPTIFPNAAFLRASSRLGRLNVTSATGDTDGDGDYDAMYTLGGRSFSIWSATGDLVFDSGDALEQITAAEYPLFFNASNTDNTLDSRSDNKGPEPEAVTIGKAYGRIYAFIGLERVGGVVVFDITNPYDVRFIQYVNNRNFNAATNSAAAGDLGPEGIHFISADESPTGVPLIAVANEVSGSTSIFEFTTAR